MKAGISGIVALIVLGALAIVGYSSLFAVRQTEQALEHGVDVVIAAGGDGTVRTVAEVLRGRGVPIALLPSGTGNLLARNLNLTLDDVGHALDSAFGGDDRSIDMGVVELRDGTGPTRRHAYLVMAGVGIDWACGHDLGQARSAAKIMMATYEIRFPAALVSRHTQRRAIDMTVGWQGTLAIRDFDGRTHRIADGPRNGANPELIAVGRSFGVIKLPGDPPHWSDDGH